MQNKKIINIKITSKKQILSVNNYDQKEQLNEELAKYIIAETDNVGHKQQIKLIFNSDEILKQNQIEENIKTYFNYKYTKIKQELSNINFFVIIMLYLGLITFSFLSSLQNYAINNFYINTMLEIAAWVFVWEAVDILFLQRPKLRRSFIQMQKICKAEVVIIFTKKEKS